MRRISSKSKTLGLIAGLALTAATMATAARAAETPSGTEAAGSGATFVNSGNHHVTLYTRFGSDGDCEGQPKEQTVNLDPKQTVSVDSGSSNVCFCTRVPDGRTCPSGWITVKPGGTKHLM
jgi:hypothetical protein